VTYQKEVERELVHISHLHVWLPANSIPHQKRFKGKDRISWAAAAACQVL